MDKFFGPITRKSSDLAYLLVYNMIHMYLPISFEDLWVGLQ